MSDPDLPRLIAQAFLAVLIVMACFPGHAAVHSEANHPESLPRRVHG